MRAALAAVPGPETPAAAPAPVAAAPPASQAPFVVLGNGDLDRALSSVEETIRLEPNNASAYAARGRVFEKKGDPRRALADFNKALTLQSDLPSAIAGRDRMRAALAAAPASPNSQAPPLVAPTPAVPSATPTAVAVASPATQARPPAAAPVVDQDWEACQQAVQVVHDRDKQIAGCTRVLSRGSKETDANRETAFVRRGEAYNDKGDRRRAIADFSDAVRINPFDAEALFYLAAATGSAPARPTFAPPAGPAPALVTASPTGPASRPTAPAAPAPTPTATSVAALPAAPAPPPAVAPAAPSPAAPPAPLGRRVALIVANHAYAAAPLANPPIDAGLVKASLEKVGFSVVVRNDLDLEAFEQAIVDFAETSRGADVALFYFAGHGFSIAASGRQQNLLMATSANFAAKSALVLQGGGEPLEHVEETIIGHARATLIFIDACRNIPALAGRGGGSRGFAPSDSESRGGLRRAVDAPGHECRGRRRRPGQPVRTGLRVSSADARLAHRGRLLPHPRQGARRRPAASRSPTPSAATCRRAASRSWRGLTDEEGG